ncbi:MAG TPA: NADH-quinone oxidoreductase subunit L [Actinomycetota bacterium]|jgi:NADH-quinone oxidoreductase subunit L|nr:NADH-quinone oxidoreductase subunit L [Actinomycetota bacterium]
MERLAWLVPALTLAAWALILLVGRRLPGKGAPFGILAVGAGWLLSLGILGRVIGGAAPYHLRGDWAPFSTDLRIPIGITVDGLAAVLLVVVTTVSLLVQIYSVGYMRGDERYVLFFANLSLFTSGMLIVVLADNLLFLLVGWEIMGVCSYFLIGHWWEDPANARAAIKAFLVTRVGDIGFLFGIFVFFWAAKSFEIERIIAGVESGAIGSTTVTLGAVLLFCGAIGKSGQFPLHVWLPDAMAGPTPVSALIHAATMVAAGVFLVARMFPVFEASATAMNEIAVIASITMLIAALLALVQDDIKRVLAYSTVSQLAYMMAGLGVGGYESGVFHLFTHAFFKAGLFLAAGCVIHAVGSNSMSRMGGLAKVMPWTFWSFTVGALALAGIFPLAGFWSKDEILTEAWNLGFGTPAEHVATSQGVAQIVFVTGMFTAFLTAFYVARMLWLTFGSAYRGDRHPHEPDGFMLLPVVLLAVGAALAGLLGSPLMGETNFGSWIATPQLPARGAVVINWGLAATATAVALVGMALGWRLYRKGLPEREYLTRLPLLYTTLEHKFYLDDLYERGIVRGVVGGLAPATYWFDQRVIDGVVNGIALGTRQLARGLRYVQTGQAQWYAAALFVGVVGLAVVVTQVIGR